MHQRKMFLHVKVKFRGGFRGGAFPQHISQISHKENAKNDVS